MMNIEPVSQLSGEASVKRRENTEEQKNAQETVQEHIQEPKKEENRTDRKSLEETRESPRDYSKIPEKELKKERAEIEKTVEDMNLFLESQKKTLSFFVDKESGRSGVKVIDSKTNKIIKQIPPDEVLDVAAKIKEMLGALIDKTV